MKQWHLVYTKPHQETPVNRLLQQIGWETFLPGVIVERGYGRGQRLDPFFPQYIFLHVDMNSVQARQISYMTGIRNVVAFDGVPLVVPADVLDEIRNGYEEYLRRKTDADDSESAAESPAFDSRATRIRALFRPGLTGAQRSQLLLHVLAK